MDEKTYSTIESVKLVVALVGVTATTAVACHTLYKLAKDLKAEYAKNAPTISK
jgi:hypothetical protein